MGGVPTHGVFFDPTQPDPTPRKTTLHRQCKILISRCFTALTINVLLTCYTCLRYERITYTLKSRQRASLISRGIIAERWRTRTNGKNRLTQKIRFKS